MRSDIKNIDEFFSRRGVATLGIKLTFDLLTNNWGQDGGESEDDIAAEVQRLLSLPESSTTDNTSSVDPESTSTAQERRTNEDSVFAQSYIPQTLHEVYDAERDTDKIAEGKASGLIYAGLAGLNKSQPAKPSTLNKVAFEVEASDSATASESGSEEDDSEAEEDDFEKRPKGKKFEDKDAKKVI